MSIVSARPSGAKVPRYCKQQEKGRPNRAYCRIDGKKVFLGKHGTPESRNKYAELIASLGVKQDEPEEQKQEPPANPVVNFIVLEFLKYALEYYPPKGNEKYSASFLHYREVCRYLRHKDYGDDYATNFGPRKLKRIRDKMIAKGLSRRHINEQVRRIVRVFKWAASEELVPGSVAVNLATVEGLRTGKTSARESKLVPPVPSETVKATLPFMPEIVADMCQVQLLLGCRPKEVCDMRPCDIDRKSEIWTYVPESHKTQHHGKERRIAIGPKAQAILLRYLARESSMCCFRPIDSVEKHRKVAGKSRQPGERYTSGTYRNAVIRASERAGVEHWTPNQLRHTRATEIRHKFGLEAAQVVLGHSRADTTQIYAETNYAQAEKVAAAVG